MTTNPKTAAAVNKARHEGAIEALRSAAEHMSVGAAIGPVPIEVRPVVEAWLCRLAEQRLGRAKKEAADRLHEALATPPTTSVPSAPVDRAAKAEALLLHFTAEAHRRKWAYDRGLDDDGVPLKSEAFDALHRLGEEMNAALHKLRRMADEEQQPETQARVVAYRSPGTRTLYCVICARQETGWQPVTDADEQAVCDFCGGRVHAVAARTLGDVVARHMTAEAQHEPVCICGHPTRLHHEDACLLTGCGCADVLEVSALPEALEAVLTKRFTELGNQFAEMRLHEQGPDGWPSSHPVGPHQVAEVLRELLATDAPAAVAQPVKEA